MGRSARVDAGRRILVTGASGLLGRSLATHLSEMGTVNGTGYSSTADTLVRVDLRDAEAIHQVVTELNPDVVVHSAAYRDPDFCEENPEEAYRLNVFPVERLCEFLPETVRLIFISSDYVFDGGAAPYGEDDDRRPVNRYGRFKVEAEDLVLERDTGLVLRIPLLIGAGPTWRQSGFIYKTLTQIRDPRPSSLDHANIRFPTWIEDVAAAVAHLVEIEANGVYHYSSVRGGTKYEWALELAGLAEFSTKHIAPDRDGSVSRAPRPGNTQLAVDKIRSSGLSRFTPFRDVAESVLQQFSVVQ